tara:strand:- start:1090 stop:2028 length:939 start_codon:yes stop_codon:yes gene_type:complete
MMIRKISYLIIIIFIFLTNIKVHAKSEIYVDLTVNEKILTNYDIEKEINYLKILNPQLHELNRKQISQIARNSLINEIIKKDELLKFFNFEKKITIIDKIYKEFYTNLGYPKEDDFKKILIKKKTYTNDEIKNKMKIEFFWNRVILERYSDQVKIDKEKLLKKIDNDVNKFETEYLLSEIFFNKDKDLIINEKIKEIERSIIEVGFNNTASLFSQSESANLGGKIGWINEKSLSQKIIDELKITKNGNHTKVIQFGNNFLILKIEDKKTKEINIDKEDMLEKIIEFEKNKQLNQFSNIYFNKIKVNYSINEK